MFPPQNAAISALKHGTFPDGFRTPKKEHGNEVIDDANPMFLTNTNDVDYHSIFLPKQTPFFIFYEHELYESYGFFLQKPTLFFIFNEHELYESYGFFLPKQTPVLILNEHGLDESYG